MESKKVARLLKVMSAAAALVGVLFFFWYVPKAVNDCAVIEPEAAWLKWPGLIGMWVIALFCYLALGEFWSVCTRIGTDNSFCAENSRSMKQIGMLAFLTGASVLAGAVFLGFCGYLNGALACLVFFILCIAAGIGVTCLALSSLIGNAARLKEENDLTI